MSVPEGERSHGDKLEVLVKARELATYTLHICTNENTFQPQYQGAITGKIEDTAISIFMDCWTANNVLVREAPEKWLYRTEFTKSFIYDNMACQKGKGTDRARGRLECFMQKSYRKNRRESYVLQCDIKGYYPNMRHDVAKEVFAAALDPEIFAMASRVLDGQYSGEVGFNPGSQMVQICGISVLNKLDHYIKERLRVKFYIRYMDDLILIHEDRAYLERCKEEIRARLSEIGMEFNEKKTRIYPITEGIMFLGFRFRLSETGKIYKQIDPKNVKAERKRLARMASLVKKGERTREKANACYASWRAHAEHGNSYKLLKRMDEYYKSLWR